MTALGFDLGVSLLALGLAFAAGPVRYPVRAALRRGGPACARRYEQAVSLGLLLGFTAAVLMAPAFALSPLWVAAAALLLLLAAADAAWRWLPTVWTLLLAALGATQLLGLPDPGLSHLGQRLMEAGGVMAALWLLRQSFVVLRGQEALGLGDIWLAGALALWLGAALTVQVLGFAAALGILSFLVTEQFSPPQRRRMGVAFGTHICFISAIYLTWFTTGPLSAYS